ncbi:TIGR03083 family protein [Nocardia amikacinitolerans]|uniref:maleylpyruvate isomerase family mycothiol-dependent enzyme n=1 Tax=Nocardia amikacinitolerans TaxID=756689 RepID=UPI0020A33B62|nr:maleylpyruvate isomerase family mycothiol-dependent enzyme [Nocardia amikacinitolerans]MCP2293899.1 TIGR03083 family protein [Nocardia amikacinitolerans]
MTENIWRAVARERAELADMLAAIPESAWQRPSLCAGWRIADVVAHVVLSSRVTLGVLAVNMIRARGDIDRMIRDTAIRLADRSTPPELLARLRATVDHRNTAAGTTPTDRLMDLLVHGQDIAVPLGLSREMPVAAARISLDRVWTMGRTFQAARRFSGYRLTATDTGWQRGDGPEIEGPVSALLLLATGREVALDRLTGPGVPGLAARLRQ